MEESRHPFLEGLSKHRGVPPTVVVIFGASGDLAARKLIPAIYNLSVDNLLPNNFRLIGFGRKLISNQEFRRLMREALEKLEDTSGMALGGEWCALTESGAHKRLDRILPDGVSPYGLRHSFRANAIASDAGDNAAIIGGWKSSNGLSPIMFNYGQDAFCRTETLKGLERTSKKINQHLIEALN